MISQDRLSSIISEPRNFTADGAAAVINAAIHGNDYELYKKIVSHSYRVGFSTVRPTTLATQKSLFEKLHAKSKSDGTIFPLSLFYREAELAQIDEITKVLTLISRYDLPMSSKYADVLSDLYRDYLSWHYLYRQPQNLNAFSLSLLDVRDPTNVVPYPPEEVLFRIYKLFESYDCETITLHYARPHLMGAGCFSGLYGTEAHDMRNALFNHPLFVHHFAERKTVGSQNVLYHSFVLAGKDEKGNQKRLRIRFHLGTTRKYVNKSLEKEWRKLARLPDEHVDLVTVLADTSSKDGALGMERSPEGDQPFTAQALAQTSELVCDHPDSSHVVSHNFVASCYQVYITRTFCQRCDKVLEREVKQTYENIAKFEKVEKLIAAIEQDLQNGRLSIDKTNHKFIMN